MLTKIHLVASIIFLFFLFGSCSSEYYPTKELPITIIGFGEFNNRKLPSELIDILTAFKTTDSTEQFILTPRTELIFYSYRMKMVTIAIPPTNPEKVQGYLGSKGKKNLKKETDKEREFFDNYLLELDPSNFQNDNGNTIDSICKLIAEPYVKDTVFVYMTSPKSPKEVTYCGRKYKILHSPINLQSAILNLSSSKNGSIQLLNRYIVLYNPPISNDSIEDPDLAYNEFLSWKSKSNRTLNEIESYLKSLELRFKNDYRFTLDRLIARTRGDIKQSDFYLLVQAVIKAVYQGKTEELLKMLSSIKTIKVPPQVVKIIKNKTPEKLVTIVNPIQNITPDFTLSFNKLSLEQQINFLSNEKYSLDARERCSDIIINKFISPQVNVLIYSNSDKLLSTESIDSYLYKVRLTRNYTVLVQNTETENGKITKLKVKEIYN